MKYSKHLATKSTLAVVFKHDNGKEELIQMRSSDPNFDEAKKAIADKKFDNLAKIMSPNERLADTGFKVEKGGTVKLDGEELPVELRDKLTRMLNSGQETTVLKKLWGRLKKNPDPHSRSQLFAFIDKNDVTILHDGTFVLYKRVRDDMTSHHCGKFLHVLGQRAFMDRSKCDSNPHSDCSSGLHVAPWCYVKGIWGRGRLLAMIIDPEHVVSVPHHCNGQKMRVCEYIPWKEVTEPIHTSNLTPFSKDEADKEKVAKTKATRHTKSVIVNLTTDRITIPGSFMNTTNIPNEVEVYHTDKRSRFLLIDGHDSDGCDHKHVWSTTTKRLSSGSLVLRLAWLREAKIGEPNTQFKVSVVEGHLEVRPV